MKRFALAALWLILVSTASAQTNPYPTPEIRFPNGVRGIPDVVYWRPLGYRPLELDLYLPPSAATQPAAGFPVVVFLHGGGWLRGNPRSGVPLTNTPSLLADVAARGYVVVAVAYRFSGEAKFPAQMRDVRAALRWLRLRAPTYGIDASRVIAWGLSAGAHLATLAGVACDVAAFTPIETVRAPVGTPYDSLTGRPASECVQGVVSWYGPYNFATLPAQARNSNGRVRSRDAPEAEMWQLLGCYATECTAGQIPAASPITYVDSHDPPLLIISAPDDRLVPFEQTTEMVEQLKAIGAPFELLLIPGVDHGFVGPTPEITMAANRKALAATLAFIDRIVGRSASGTQ